MLLDAGRFSLAMAAVAALQVLALLSALRVGGTQRPST
jgi:hypothetical protein